MNFTGVRDPVTATLSTARLVSRLVLAAASFIGFNKLNYYKFGMSNRIFQRPGMEKKVCK